MKLERWALIAEILSAVAVVASLIFVGLQVRQGAEETALNTRAIQASAYQDLIAQISSLNTLSIENPQFAELRARVITHDEAPQTVQELEQMRAFFLLAFRHGDSAFRQYENGLIDEPSLLSVLGPIRAYLRREVAWEIWERTTALNPQYRSYVNEMMSELARGSAESDIR